MEDVLTEDSKNYIRTAIRKIDLRLMPFLFILEFISYVNRVTMAYARKHGLTTDLHLSPMEEKLAVSMLYVAYFVFAVPSVLVLRRIGPNVYNSILLVAWGSLSIGSAFVKNGLQLIIVQFLLGMMIAGFFPGMIFYLSLWYHRNERTMRIAIFYMAAIMAGAIGGILGYGIVKMDGLAGLNGWQWIFLLLGIPVVVLGLIALIFLDNIPGNVAWLTTIERDVLINYLRDLADIDPEERIEERNIPCHQVFQILKDRMIWLFTLVVVANLLVIKYSAIAFPHFIQAIGYGDGEEQLLIIPPFVLACISVIVGAIVVTKTKEHGYCVAFFLIVSCIGFILMAALANSSEVALYISAYVACSGVYPAFALLMAWLASSVRGHFNKALAASLPIGLGQLGGIIFPFIVQADDANHFREPHIICAVAMAVAAILTFLLRYLLKNRPTIGT